MKFQFNGINMYIDDRLANVILKKVVPALKRKDKDAVFCVDGGERTGKSVFSMGLASFIALHLQKKFDLTNICMTPAELRERIMKAQKNECIIYDEAHRGMGSSRVLSEINNILKDLMMEMGQKNLFVIIVLPTFFLLDKYAALFRAKGLFHIYERKGHRGYWCFFNKRNKLKLYLYGKKEFNYNCMRWSRFRGRFTDAYPVPEGEYRMKKKKSFEEKPRTTRVEKVIGQRDVAFYVLWKEYSKTMREAYEQLKLYGLPTVSYVEFTEIIKRKQQEYLKSSSHSKEEDGEEEEK